VTDLEVPCI